MSMALESWHQSRRSRSTFHSSSLLVTMNLSLPVLLVRLGIFSRTRCGQYRDPDLEDAMTTRIGGGDSTLLRRRVPPRCVRRVDKTARTGADSARTASVPHRER